jgi:hypothetical protein
MKLIKHDLNESQLCQRAGCIYYSFELYSIEGEEKRYCNDCMLNRLLEFDIVERNA